MALKIFKDSAAIQFMVRTTNVEDAALAWEFDVCPVARILIITKPRMQPLPIMNFLASGIRSSLPHVGHFKAPFGTAVPHFSHAIIASTFVYVMLAIVSSKEE